MQQLLYLFLILHATYKVSCSGTETYRAAVLEYAPPYTDGDSAETIFKASVADYEKYIAEASQQSVDIIVFPEIGLSSIHLPHDRNQVISFAATIPTPEEKITPCNQNDAAFQLRAISCAAAKNKIYVAINLPEAYNCSGESECADNGFAFYNTEVVFDRKGVVVARYRKVNLFFEPGFNVTKVPEIVSFETDFGVKFGIIICFDLFFKTPAIDLVREYGIHDFVYSTAWFSQLPFITAVQFHSAWAYSNDVALLSSGYNNPLNSNEGSGIFVGKNGIAQELSAKTRMNKMLIADVPKYQYRKTYKLEEPTRAVETFNREEITVFRENLSSYNTVNIKSRDFKTTLCQGDLCCDFHIDGLRYQDAHYRYRAVVFNGKQNVVVVDASVQVCAVINCLGVDVDSCGRWNGTADTGIEFNTLSIQGNFTASKNTAQFPSTVDTNLLPLRTSEYEYVSDSSSTKIKLLKPRNGILTFGIFGRNYANDELLDMERVLENMAVSKEWSIEDHLPVREEL